MALTKLHDMIQAVRGAHASISTVQALIEQASGPDRTNLEGYVGGRVRKLLEEADQRVKLAESLLGELPGATV